MVLYENYKKECLKVSTLKARSKYNWHDIKQDFFSSNFQEVMSYLRHTFGTDIAHSWVMRKNTKWWTNEKKQIQEEMKSKAIEDFKTNLKNQWDNTLNKIEIAIIKWLNDICDMVLLQGEVTERNIIITVALDNDPNNGVEQRVVKRKTINPYLWPLELINIIKHIRLEKMEPIEFIKSPSKAKIWLKEMRESFNK